MFRGTFSRAARTVPELRNGHSVRTSAIAGLAEAEPHVNEGHDEWVKTDVVNDGEGWTARFSDITTEELRNAAASMGLVRRTRQAPTEELEADSSVEEIDADAQMREVQSGDAWAVHNAFPSVTEFAMQMAQRPSIQRAILEEIRADEELRLSFERLSRRHGVELRLLPLSGGSPALIGAGDDEGGAVDKDTHPLEALFNGLLNAAEAAGAAIGTYVKRMLQHILSLGRLLRGKRASTADGVVFDDESAVAVNKAQVMLDMSLAVASLLVLVAVLGRVGARVFMRP